MAIQQLEPREVVAPQPSAEPGWAETRRTRRFDPVDAVVILLLIGLVYGLAVTAARWTTTEVSSVTIDLSPSALPGYAVDSLIRMTAAYLLSMAFSLSYGHLAAQSKAAERIMLPVLDILQSIPILSFMPGVVLALLAIFPNNNVGLELAAILLVFTSQAWNITFSFYQSLQTIPRDLSEAASIYHLSGWRRFFQLEVAFATIGLVWNSMMSWAGGWFFLIAAEQFTLGDKSFELPGLGSYLSTAANSGNVSALGLGLATLIVIIVLLDQFLWRPLVAWAVKFRFEQTESADAPTSWVLTALRRSALIEWWSERALPTLVDAFESRTRRAPPGDVRAGEVGPIRGLIGWIAIGLLGLGAGWGIWSVGALLVQLDLGEWAMLPGALVATFLRTLIALGLGLAWTVPVGVLIGLDPTWSKRAQPLAQLAASIPATALFPVLLLILLGLPGGLNIAAVALMLLGTQWYLLFNIIAGAQSIPSDLREAANVYQLRGWRRWRLLLLPGIFPYLITGAITATGGAWNASIVSEYVTFGGVTYQTVGLGATIASAANAGNFPLLAAATLVMALAVVTVNRLVWRRLYRLAERHFRLD
ncbi:MAG: ABC transporter permease subunit [Chloroflexi bacterium]|nr:ABC transporter permease subunit [Chloroflexota bacterium]